MEQVGFVGLGVMGGPMAGHLLKAGHSVSVWNRTASKSATLGEAGAHICESLKEVAERCSVIFLCVSRSEDVDQCLSELEKHAKPGTLFVDHSTIAPSAAVKFHEQLTASGFHFIDAPITGGSMGAQSGTLTIFCGGEDADIARAMPLMSAYAKRAEKVGPGGFGQQMKLANQIAVGGALQALCESLAFAKKAGLDLHQAREMIGGGAAGSWAFENYGPKILNHDWAPGFSIDNQRKDFGYCKDAADQIDAYIPSTILTDELLKRLQDAGHGDWTTAALYEVMLSRGAKSD